MQAGAIARRPQGSTPPPSRPGGLAASKFPRPALIDEVVCPHCWGRFEPAAVLWVARHEELRGGGPVLDRDDMLRFLPSRFTPEGDALDAGGMVCHELACPRCHLAIPRRLLERRQTTFSVVGVPGCGKSYFLVATAWESRRVLPQRFGLRFSDVDPGINRVLNGYEETLFLQEDPESPVYIDKTQIHGSHYDQVNLNSQPTLLAHPFLFAVDAANDDPAASRVLCFYDNAGEHFYPGGDTTLAPGSRHVALADALFFLYDPLQDARFRERCRAFSRDPQLNLAPRSQRQDTVLTEAAERVRRYAGLSPSRKLQQPLIVVVGKADVWGAPLAGIDLTAEPVTDESPARLDAARVRQVSNAVRDVLQQWTPEFVAAAEGHYDKVVYIPVSALGGSPRPPEGEAKGLLMIRPREIHPRWVTVPMLYALGAWLGGPIGTVDAH